MGSNGAVVVIGRNEGERLRNCLLTLFVQTQKIVYVDSGSTDESITFAKSLGIFAVELDKSLPFSAGRARNEGFAKILHLWPDVIYVQFVDGDCELEQGWLDIAEKMLASNSGWAIVSGRVSERNPGKSIYNDLCDIEWDTPAGYTEACGGIFMVKVNVFKKLGGFNSQVIAGEEPELCYRLRQNGMVIYKLAQPMAIHDANITRFSQWWKRAMRSGYAYAQGFFLHGREGKGYCLRDSLRIWFWAFLFPCSILLFVVFISPGYLFLFSLYPAHAIKIAITSDNRMNNFSRAMMYALFTIISKWAQMYGYTKCLMDQLFQRAFRKIEYK